MSNTTAEMKNPVYGFLSLILPLFGIFSILMLSSLVHIEDSAHGFTGLYLALEILLYFLIMGMIISLIALFRKERFWALGYIGILLNGVPAVFLIMQC